MVAKSNCNFFILKVKKMILPLIFLIFTLSLLIFSKSNLPAIRNSLTLWVNSVIPSLFPFFVATELLMHTNILNYFELLFIKIMRPLFNVSGKASFAFIMGIISGYPIGAKIACEFRKKNICSKNECERLLSFTNNSGPLFIVGSVGISMFGSSLIGILLFISHFLASIAVGFIFRFWKYNEKDINKIDNTHYSNQNNNATFSNLGNILAQSIKSATATILMIGGFIVVFSCIISILNSSGFFKFIEIIFVPLFNILHIDETFIKPLFTGFLEITNGINLISNINIKEISINIILTSFLLGVGGLSVFLQVLSIVSKTDLSIKPYIFGKIIHGIISAIFTFLLIQIFPFFNFNL